VSAPGRGVGAIAGWLGISRLYFELARGPLRALAAMH